MSYSGSGAGAPGAETGVRRRARILEFRLENRDSLPESLDFRRNRMGSLQDRLRLFELHPTDGRLLKQTFAELVQQVRIEAADGFEGLMAVLPPPSRRGLTLIDP
ncbi:MAG: 23S rRNA (adenine(2030)-N(6))-methyltransferase RlmJ, partial [Pseudarthrobacter sp.]